MNIINEWKNANGWLKKEWTKDFIALFIGILLCVVSLFLSGWNYNANAGASLVGSGIFVGIRTQSRILRKIMNGKTVWGGDMVYAPETKIGKFIQRISDVYLILGTAWWSDLFGII